MSLSARLTSPARKPTGIPCSVGALRQELPSSEAAALDKMLYDLGWSASRVYDELAEEGHEVSLQTIGRHRRGECRCGRSQA